MLVPERTGPVTEPRSGGELPLGGVAQKAGGGETVAAGEILGLAQGLAGNGGDPQPVTLFRAPVPGQFGHRIGGQPVQRPAQIVAPPGIGLQRGVKDLIFGDDQRHPGVGTIGRQSAQPRHLGPEIRRIERRHRNLGPAGKLAGRGGPFHQVHSVAAERQGEIGRGPRVHGRCFSVLAGRRWSRSGPLTARPMDSAVARPCKGKHHIVRDPCARTRVAEAMARRPRPGGRGKERTWLWCHARFRFRGAARHGRPEPRQGCWRERWPAGCWQAPRRWP